MTEFFIIGLMIGFVCIMVYLHHQTQKHKKRIRQSINKAGSNTIGMVDWNEGNDSPYNILHAKIQKKIMDLQDQLIRHYTEPGFKLAENDLIRYSAMVDVLKAMIN